MPTCSDCSMLIDDRCRAHEKSEADLGRVSPPPPIGGCEVPIVEQYLPLIQAGMRVLEVGCGAWGLIRDRCAAVGAHYEGIDTVQEYFGVKSVATRFENLAELSFADDSFDLVIGNQTMEHWNEYGCRTDWGLYQCFRVCRPGGQVLLNVPIHYHGTRLFLLGETDKIRDLFTPFSSAITMESWGKDSGPIAPYYAHPNYSRLKNKSAYNLDIRVVKNRPLPTGHTNHGAYGGWKATYLGNPKSYVLHRLLCKLGVSSTNYPVPPAQLDRLKILIKEQSQLSRV
jgi:SAM-dependent methyltransferase